MFHGIGTLGRGHECRGDLRLRACTDSQLGQCDRCPARALLENLLRQIAHRFDKKVFLYDAFVFFKRTFDPVHVIAVSVGHRGDDPVIAMSLGAKERTWNPSHHFTNAELTHRSPPPSLKNCGTSPSTAAPASVVTA